MLSIAIAPRTLLVLGLAACIVPAALAQFITPEHPAYAPAGGMPPAGALLGPPPGGPGGPPPPGGPPGGGGRSPGSDPTLLLANSPAVQSDLGLSEDQIRRLRQTEQGFRKQQQDQGETLDASARADLERQVRTSGGTIDQILTTDQLQRLKQIMLQMEGPCLAINDPYFIREMSLGRAQQREIVGICRRNTMEIRRAIRPPQSAEDACAAALAVRTRIQRTQLQGEVQIEGLLSQQQRDKLAQMQGPAVTLEPMLPPPCRHRVPTE